MYWSTTQTINSQIEALSHRWGGYSNALTTPGTTWLQEFSSLRLCRRLARRAAVAQDNRQPIAALGGLQRDARHNCQRHRQQHADRAEQPAPKNQRQEHHQRRQPQPAPHHPRFEDIADHHVDCDKTSRHHQRITQSVEQQRLNQRRNGGQYRADIGNIVEQKRQQPPDKGEAYADRRQEDPDDHPGGQANDGFNHQITRHAVQRPPHRGEAFIRLIQRLLQLIRQQLHFKQHKHHGHQQQEDVGQ